jgi:hypothetical protein
LCKIAVPAHIHAREKHIQIGRAFSRHHSRRRPFAADRGLSQKALPDAGLYIRGLERFLVLTALLVQSPAMIGLILAGQSIARHSELNGSQFAEYFPIGTLLSLGLALSGGGFPRVDAPRRDVSEVGSS